MTQANKRTLVVGQYYVGGEDFVQEEVLTVGATVYIIKCGSGLSTFAAECEVANITDNYVIYKDKKSGVRVRALISNPLRICSEHYRRCFVKLRKREKDLPFTLYKFN